MTLIARTDKLLLRHITPADAAFYRQLVNEPAWIASIGDRQVGSLRAAQQQIRDRLMASYDEHGFGLYLVALKDSGPAVGICGLVKRDTLTYPDIGFAFLQAHWGRGYALEAARAVLEHGFGILWLQRILGITTRTNERSARLLGKLGFLGQGPVLLGELNRDLFQLETPISR